MDTVSRGLSLTAIGLIACLTGCGRPASDAASSTAAPAPETVELGDPVSNAIVGSTERALKDRYSNASVILAEEVLSTTAAEHTICGRFILITRDTRRDRFFIAGPATLTELKTKTDPRWIEACSAAKPLPGAVSAVEAEAQAASLASH